MQIIMMHRTEPRWEAGLPPEPELIAKVGGLMGEMGRVGILRGGEGLRSSAFGVRLSFADGKRRITRGPFKPAEGAGIESGFLILRVRSLEEAIEWSTRLGFILGDTSIELRPVTEPWDIGMAPPPEQEPTQRFMALLKARESDAPKLSAEREELRARLLEEMTRSGVMLANLALRPAARGSRLQRTGDRISVIDGPFAESKELIAGYVLVDVPTHEEARSWARRYIETVGAEQVDVRELDA